MTHDLVRRKAGLIVQGAELRAGVATSRGALRVSFSAESMRRLILDVIVNFGCPKFRNLLIRETRSWRALIPLAIAGIPLVSRNARINRFIEGVMLVATIAMVGRRLAITHKKARSSSS